MLLRACERALAEAGVEREGTARVLVACSGGPDSVALLRVAMVLLGSDRVIVGHVDHGVRPDSAAHAAAVRALADREGLARLEERLDPSSSDEATLRTLRYEALERMRVRAGAELILVAHTEDDQAETVLLRLLRTTGVHSLAGMPPRNGRVLRPLLSVPRAAVHRYLRYKGWPAQLDPTNLEPAYLRNRVRKELMPLLERRYAHGIARRLAGLADQLRGGSGIERRPSPPGKSQPGESEQGESVPVAPRLRDLAPVPSEFEWVERGVIVDYRPWSGGHPRALPPGIVVFDAVGLEAGLGVRPFRAGDRIRPFGRLHGHKKVAEVLREAGVPVALRGRWPLLVDVDDRVLWVSGLLRSDVAPVEPSTRAVWVASRAVDAGR